MILADRLSRFPLQRENVPIELHQNTQHLAFTPDKINIIRGAVERDPHFKYCLLHHLKWMAEQDKQGTKDCKTILGEPEMNS